MCCHDDSLLSVVEDFSPLPWPTPVDSGDVYLNEWERDEHEEDDDHDEVVHHRSAAGERGTQAHPRDGAEAFSLNAEISKPPVQDESSNI